jgi:hypothetical protein
MAGSSLYETDVVLWSVEQADALRRRAFDELDLENIVEEITSVGNEQIHAVESFLVQALAHDLKADAWPSSREVPSWRAEARRFRGEAIDRFTKSMQQKIDLAKLYWRARRAMPDSIDGVQPLPVPEVCPWNLDELLKEP